MKSIRIAAISVALVTTACSGGAGTPSAVPSSPPSATAAPTAGPSSPLEGIWTTAEVTCDQQFAVIHAGGITDAEITAGDWWSCSEPGYYRLRFLGDQAAIFEKSGEGDFELGHATGYKLTDDHTLVTDDGLFTASFTLVGNVLTFTSVTNNGGELGDRIAGRRIFLTAPFTKES